MTINITHPPTGRGAWSSRGGARSLDGKTAGPFYRSTTNPALPAIGEQVYKASVSSSVVNVSIDDYAVWRGALEIQRELIRQGFYRGALDGWWGPQTDLSVKNWQSSTAVDFSGKPMAVDGIYGQQTARTMWQPRLLSAIRVKANAFQFMPSQDNIDMLNDYAKATVSLESVWDIAAVGESTPKDLGPCQINTGAHKVTPADAFNPNFAFNFKANFILSNFAYSLGDIPIAIVSYNGGQGGAHNWDKAGRPDSWQVAGYLRAIKTLVKHPRLLDALNKY